MSAAETGATVAPDRVDFIYKYDAGGVFLALLEKIAYAGRADAHKHFDKVGSADRKERHIGFAGDRPSQQCFTCAWRADQQNAFGNPATKFLKFLWFLEKIDNLLKFFLCFLDSRDIFECHLLLVRRQQARPAFAER